MPFLEHIGVAVENPQAVNEMFGKLLEVQRYKAETVADQGVRTHFLDAGSAKLELLEATAPDSPVARFLEKRGEGLHHIAFEVEDIHAAMERARQQGFEPLSEVPTRGADDKLIFFIHPKATHGILVEFCQTVKVLPEPVSVPFRSGTLAAYDVGNPEAPPLLLLHGAGGATQLETAPLLRRLAPHFRTLALDFSGHGRSDEVQAPFSTGLFVENVAAVLDHFELERAFLFGFSLGGAVALNAAHDMPTRIERLAVHGTTARWSEALVDRMLSRLDPERLAENPRPAAALEAAHTDWQDLFARTASYVRTLPETTAQTETLLQHVEQPVLVSSADRDDLFPLSSALHLHEHLPESRLTILPGTRHTLPALDPFAPVLRAFFLGDE